MEKTKLDRNAAFGAAGGAAVGAWLGSSIGIAALGTAISGVVPLAVIGGYAGFRAVKYFAAKKAAAGSAESARED